VSRKPNPLSPNGTPAIILNLFWACRRKPPAVPLPSPHNRLLKPRIQTLAPSGRPHSLLRGNGPSARQPEHPQRAQTKRPPLTRTHARELPQNPPPYPHEGAPGPKKKPPTRGGFFRLVWLVVISSR